MTLTEHAYAKVNLVLRVGLPRADGLHPICSLFASLGLADAVRVEVAEVDSVACRGVDGENLAARAVAAFRAFVPDLPPLRIQIDKRIPIAAGLGGGSADAAAVLRAANRLTGAPLGAAELREVAGALGSDVPSQVDPRHALVGGVGDHVEPAKLPAMALVLVPQRYGLATPDVYAELDRLRDSSGETVPEPDLGALRDLGGADVHELAGALENDLQAAALSLCPELELPLASLAGTGALAAQVTGSGPTTFGVFGEAAAAAAAASQIEGAIVTEARAC